jgi:hypothetical protein
MTTDATGTLDEAYERLHATGPEFDGWLSNHGPMAAEAMVRTGTPAVCTAGLTATCGGWRSSRAADLIER